MRKFFVFALMSAVVLMMCGGACAADKPLVVFFSATGTTESAARLTAEATGADVYRIQAQEPYSSADLNWRVNDSRANRENADKSVRPAVAGSLPDVSKYDTIFIGYPLWWGTVPRIVVTFVEAVDLAGKVVVPFSTAASSSAGPDVSELRSVIKGAKEVKDGRTFRAGVSAEDVKKWLDGLGL